MNSVEKAFLKKVLEYIMSILENKADQLNTPVGKDVEVLLKDITVQLEDALNKL